MKEKYTFSIKSIEELDQVVKFLIEMMENGSKVVLLYGDLGAGKTTLIKKIVKALGSLDATSSPTYSLVNEYEVENGIFFHIDLYRLKDTNEALEMGVEDYIFGDNFCFIEWPQVVEPLIGDHFRLEITVEADDTRLITLV